MRLTLAVGCGLLGASALMSQGIERSSDLDPTSQIPRCSLSQGGASVNRPLTIPRSADAEVVAPGVTDHDVSSILHPVADIPLPGRPVRFDYQSEDTASGRLYISHMNDAHIVVFDTRRRRVVGQIAETPGVTGVWFVPELQKLYASVTGHHYVAVIDAKSLLARATPGPIGFPDGIAYAPGANRVFVSDEANGEELVIDGATDRVVTRIPLGGEAGNTKYDAGSGCILVAVQTLNQIVAIDPMSAKVVARYAPAGADHPHGMYVDAGGRLLFVANQGNATLEVVDLRSLQVTSIAKVGEDPDVLAYDRELHRLYVATEGAGLWIYHVVGRRVITDGRLDLAHAHTVSADPATHLVYLPLQNLDGRPVLRILSGGRP